MIDREKITLREMNELLNRGDKEANELWEKAWKPLTIQIAEAILILCDKEFDNHPSKPFWEMLKNMSVSPNPIHRAIANGYDDWTLSEIKDHGARLINEELAKSSAVLPTQPADKESVILKQSGRYRLTKEEIKRRKGKVKEALQLKKDKPNFTWKQVAHELDIPERTLRDWRHNPIYQ